VSEEEVVKVIPILKRGAEPEAGPSGVGSKVPDVGSEPGPSKKRWERRVEKEVEESDEESSGDEDETSKKSKSKRLKRKVRNWFHLCSVYLI